MQVAVFHPGTQHSWQTAIALKSLDRLAWYATSIFYDPSRFPYKLERMVPAALGRRMHAEFKRFSHPGLDPALVRQLGGVEWIERIVARFGWQSLTRRIDAYGNRWFARKLERQIATDEAFALWGYNSSSLGVFEAARRYGRTCILDRTIGDHRIYNQIMAGLMDQYGDWFVEAERAIGPRVIANDQREYELADVILTGSDFAAQTVRDAGGAGVADKVRVLNYCYDEALFARQPAPAPVGKDRPLRFLFLGLVNTRKGIHLLLEAISRIPASQAKLTIVGSMAIQPEMFARYADRVDYRPTVARADVPAIMAEHDVFLLPSYFEGAGITLYEGLASGMGLIQSRHCANAVTDDTGIMLDRLDADCLTEAMLRAVEDRDLVNHWRQNAQARARDFTFAHYRDNIGRLLDEILPADGGGQA